MDAKTETANGNRARMPVTAGIVDAWRSVFGQVVVRYAREGGLEVGKRGPAGVPLSDWTPPVINDGRKG